jgi:aldehyde dehydrogenase (NAD+)
MRTGSIAINGSYPPFPLVPFGGFKESGLGRELGPEGLANFLEPRSIGLPPELHPAGGA